MWSEDGEEITCGIANSRPVRNLVASAPDRFLFSAAEVQFKFHQARRDLAETAVTIVTSERESLARQVQSLTGTTGQRVRVGVVDTANRQARPVRRRSDKVRGLVVHIEIVPRSRGSAVPARVDDDRSIVDTETHRNPRQRGKRSQHTDVLHTRDDNCRSRVGQVSQRRRERTIRGLEAVRDGVGAQAQTRDTRQRSSWLCPVRSKAKARASSRVLTSEGAEAAPDTSPPRLPPERPPMVFTRGETMEPSNAGPEVRTSG